MRAEFTSLGARRWAEGQPAGTTVGFTCKAGSCPLAEYLTSQGVKNATVTEELYTSGENWEKTPLVMRAIVVAIDELWRADNGEVVHGMPVTREQLVAIIDAVHDLERQRAERCWPAPWLEEPICACCGDQDCEGCCDEPGAMLLGLEVCA